jgi:CDP-diacylglycerol--glycerol-3-phosphate 3-phosphatidyltransferase
MATNNYRGIYAIKPWWQRRLTGIENVLVAWHAHPDIITLAGVGCAALMAVALAASGYCIWLTLLVAPPAIARLAANALDGLVARRSGLARPWGEVFNECCDRLADTLVFAGLACNQLVNAQLAWATLVLVLLNSYLGIVAKAAGGQRLFGGLLAKADRMIYIALFSFVVLFYGCTAWNWLLLAFIPATLFTIGQRCRQAYKDLQQA